LKTRSKTETETKGRKEKSKNRAVPYLTKNEASVDSGTDGHQHNAERERWQEENRPTQLGDSDSIEKI
jgi:hypothetical protein